MIVTRVRSQKAKWIRSQLLGMASCHLYQAVSYYFSCNNVTLQGCLVMDPAGRMTCDELLDHSYFDHFRDWFKPELDMLLAKDAKKIAKSKSRMHVRILQMLLYLRVHDSVYTQWTAKIRIFIILPTERSISSFYSDKHLCLLGFLVKR